MTSATVSISSARTISTDLQRATGDLVGVSREDKGTETLVRLEGSLDVLSARTARPELDGVVNDQRSPVTIDMSALRLIDSVGVGAVVSLYKRVRAQGRRVSLQGLNGQPLAIFRLLRLDRLLAQ